MATANLNEPTSAADGNIPFIGTSADDGTGNTLREAINRINARLRELYGAQNASNVVQTPFVDNDNIKDDVIKEPKLDVTNAPTDGYVLTYDSATTGFTWEQKFDGDITSIVAGAGLTGSSLDADDATLNVIGGDGITVNADEVEATVDGSTIELSASDGTGSIRVKDNGITHDKLENRYTARVEKSDTSGAVTIDWEDGAVFEFTTDLTGALELDFTAYKAGQVITIYGLKHASGTKTITLDSDAATSETFNKVGGIDYDDTKDNVLLVECVDDGDDAVFNYVIATYESDETPS